jgi:hypothetical protein
MLFPACVSERLITTLTPCASPSQIKRFSPNLNVAVSGILVVDCELFPSPRRCRKRSLRLREGCEQLSGGVQ